MKYLKWFQVACLLIGLLLPSCYSALAFSSEEKIVMTYYFYWYRYDDQHIFNLDGSSALSTHPPDITTMDWGDVEWHENHLSRMSKIGLDVILPVYWGYSDYFEESWANVGLDRLVDASNVLRQEGVDVPKIGMFYDTTTLTYNPHNWDFTNGIPKKFGPYKLISNIDFVNRCYHVLLGRVGDEGGLIHHMHNLRTGKSREAVADDFFYSLEYLLKNVSNEEYVKQIYRLFLGRMPELDGFNYWLDRLGVGFSREQVRSGICNSNEANLSADEQGAARGLDLTVEAERDHFYNTIKTFFAKVPADLWATIDGRPIIVLYESAFSGSYINANFRDIKSRFERDFGVEPYFIKEDSWIWFTEADLEYNWGAGENAQIKGMAEIAPGYDETAIPERQGIVLPRILDDGSIRYENQWKKALDSGKNIVAIETWNEWHEGTAIAESDPDEYGTYYLNLTKTYVDVFKNRFIIQNYLSIYNDDFIKRCYRVFLNREPRASELGYWSDQLLTNSKTRVDVLRGFINSQEYSSIETSPQVYVWDLYWSVLGRMPDAGGFDDWTTQLTTGEKTRDEVLSGFLNSLEVRQ